jgi:hypothetical protein
MNSVWDYKDLRISRMSALKTASEYLIAITDKPTKLTMENLFECADKIEAYIYADKLPEQLAKNEVKETVVKELPF